MKIKLLHELIHSLKRFLLIDRTSFSYYLRLLLSLFDSNDDLIKCGKITITKLQFVLILKEISKKLNNPARSKFQRAMVVPTLSRKERKKEIGTFYLQLRLLNFPQSSSIIVTDSNPWSRHEFSKISPVKSKLERGRGGGGVSGRRGSLEAVETSSLVFVYPRLGGPSNGSLGLRS